MTFTQVLALLMISGSVFLLIVVLSLPWNPDYYAPVFASLFFAVLSSFPATLLSLRKRKRSFLKSQLFLALLGYFFLMLGLVVPLHRPQFIIFYAIIGLVFFVAATVLGIVGISQRVEVPEPVADNRFENNKADIPTVGEVMAIDSERNLITVALAVEHEIQPHCQFYVVRPVTLPNGKRIDEVEARVEAVTVIDADQMTCRVIEEFAPVRLHDEIAFA